jgi:hypothetical protein
MARMVAATLGLGLIGTFLLGLSYGGPVWLIWLLAAAGLIALASVALVRTDDIGALATWPMLSVSLIALGLLALARDGARWICGLTLAFGVGFLALTVAFILRPITPALRRRPRLADHDF